MLSVEFKGENDEMALIVACVELKAFIRGEERRRGAARVVVEGGKKRVALPA